jgi:hypothetical protein
MSINRDNGFKNAKTEMPAAIRINISISIP